MSFMKISLTCNNAVEFYIEMLSQKYNLHNSPHFASTSFVPSVFFSPHCVSPHLVFSHSVSSRFVFLVGFSSLGFPRFVPFVLFLLFCSSCFVPLVLFLSLR